MLSLTLLSVMTFYLFHYSLVSVLHCLILNYELIFVLTSSTIFLRVIPQVGNFSGMFSDEFVDEYVVC